MTWEEPVGWNNYFCPAPSVTLKKTLDAAERDDHYNEVL